MKDRICCVCNHKLSTHIDEDSGWRCHSIATIDSYQCECFLRKDRAENNIEYYDLKRRIEENPDQIDKVLKMLAEDYDNPRRTPEKSLYYEAKQKSKEDIK
jgi:hypothetical protein